MRSIVPALAAAALLTTGCGYVGDPIPPYANIPSNINGLAAVQRGSHIIVQFSPPTHTTEALPIKPPLKIDLRVGQTQENGHSDEWVAQARRVTEGPATGAIARYEIDSPEWAGKQITIAVRAIGSNGKSSLWSFIDLPVAAAPLPPQGLKPSNTAAGVHLTWQGSGDFRIFRRAAGEPGFTAVGNVRQPEWTDAAVEMGKAYTYFVQTIVPLGDRREAESDPSSEVTITPADEFAPAAPTGLRASPANASIELSWERNTEPDLAGYRVYRSTGGGAFEKIADVSAAPAYSDRAVETGKTYRYAVTAIDKSGNESPRTEPVEAVM